MKGKKKLRVAVAGAGGRMGRHLTAAVAAAPDMILAAAIVAPGKAGGKCEQGVAYTDAVDFSRIHALIDFAPPAAAVNHAKQAAQNGVAMVIGATGFADKQIAALHRAADNAAIVIAPNTGVATNVMFYLLPLAAGALGGDFDVEIFESHHRQKRDAPSGTALRMGEILAQAQGRDLAAAAVYNRRDKKNASRKKGEIGFATTRGGGVIGEHTAFFFGDSERLEITHRAADRGLFASGAIRAVRFAAGQPPGVYDMQDVLGLKKK